MKKEEFTEDLWIDACYIEDLAEDTKKSITELGDFLNFIPDSDLKEEFKFEYDNALKNINNVLSCKNSLIKNLKKIDSENEF